MEKIKEIKKQEYQGKVSYSLSTESGKNALVTAPNLLKYGGKVEQIRVGDEVNVVFEEVPKKGGGGTWTSAGFPDWEVKKDAGGSSNAGTTKSGGYAKEDVYGKIVNTALMTAASVYTSSPAGTKTVEELFELYVNIAVAKYNAVKS